MPPVRVGSREPNQLIHYIMKPSINEAEELRDLVFHIEQKLEDYKHVSEFIPKKLQDALDKMLSHYEKIQEEED
jgi:hypothetical protein